MPVLLALDALIARHFDAFFPELATFAAHERARLVDVFAHTPQK